MKDKLEFDYIVKSDLDPHGADYGIPLIKLGYLELDKSGIKPGDKVKVVIIKEG